MINYAYLNKINYSVPPPAGYKNGKERVVNVNNEDETTDNQSPIIEKRQQMHPSTHSIVTSTTFVDDENEFQRLAKLAQDEINAKYFMRLRLKQGFTPFNIITYYILCFTIGVVLQFLTV